MGKRITVRGVAATLGIALVSIAVGAATWWYRPWSDYSPSEVYAFSRAQDRTVPFRMMEQIYPYREIAPSPTATPLPRAERTLDPDGVTLEDGTRIEFAAVAEARDMTGFLVLANGEVALERYFNGETAEDRHTAWSVAKSVIATLIGRALMDGTIESLDDPVSRYASEYRGTAFGDVSLRHLLMMASGIDFNEDYEVEGSDIRKLFFGTFFWNRDVDSIIAPYGTNRPAGETFDYISPNSAVLAAVLRGAYGEPLAQIAERELFAPLGMSGGTWLTDAQGGKEIGYCCLQITLQDFARLGQLYVDGGVANGTRIVPEEWIEFVSTPPTPSHEPGPPGSAKQGYGHHFWVPPGANGEFFMQGYNGQIVWIDTRRDVVVAMTSADQTWPAAFTEFVAMARALARDAAKLGGDEVADAS